MRLLTLPSVLVAALLLASSCLAEPVKIRLAWVVPVSNWGSMLFEKQGLARHMGQSYVLEPVHFNGTPPMITALATGDLEIASLAFSSLALAVANAGMDDLRVIADEFQDGVPGTYSNQYFVKKDSPIKSVADLKGKVLATNAAGSAVDIAMRVLLRKNGLEDKRDLTIVEAPFPNMKAMLIEGKVDLVPGVLPFSTDPQLTGAARELFTQRDAIGTTQMLVWAAKAGFLQKNRAAMLDFMEDALRALHFWLDPANHKEAVETAARITKQPPQVFDSWLFTKNDNYRDPNFLPNIGALQANIDQQQSVGFLPAKLDISRNVDLSIVKEAAQRLK